MNQQLAIYVAFAFLVLVGLFNMVYGLTSLKKRKAKKGWLWFRFSIGFFIFFVGMFLGYTLIWTRLQ